MSRPFWVDHCVHAQYQLETALNDSMCPDSRVRIFEIISKNQKIIFRDDYKNNY